MDTIAITIDVDWAPDFVIDNMADVLTVAGVAATWFVTHDSPAIRRLSDHYNLFEIGIHPNFLPGSTQGSTPHEVLTYCTDLFPDAVSLRTHGLLQSTDLIGFILENSEVNIDASLFLPGAENLAPIDYLLNSRQLTRIPYIWEDDFYIQNSSANWDPNLWANHPGLRVFDFHPVHFMLNSRSDLSYKIVKTRCPRLQDAQPRDFKGLINGQTGTRTFFEGLVGSATINGSTTLRDLVADRETEAKGEVL